MKKLLLLAAATALLASCAPARFAKGTTASDIDSMLLLQPDTYITYIGASGEVEHSDSLSEAAAEILIRETLGSGLPVQECLLLDGNQKREMKSFMQMMLSLRQKVTFELEIPSLLDLALESRGYRYGLIIISEGMTRDVKNYKKEAFFGVTLAIVTAVISALFLPGNVDVYSNSLPARYSARAWAVVLDAETNRVVFRGETNEEERNPLDERTARSQIRQIFRRFLM